MSEGVKGVAWDSNRANFDRNLAVVIGIDRYSNGSIRNLSTAVSDARAINAKRMICKEVEKYSGRIVSN